MLVRSPLRVSLVGGGSDLRYFYSSNLAQSIGFSINKYVYVYVSDFIKNKINFTSSNETVITDDHNLIKNEILRGFIKSYKINSKKYVVFSDLFSGTGLGSSSAMAVSLIYTLQNHNKNKGYLAEEAFKLEEEISGSTVGKQDHYFSAYGGFNKFIYSNDSKVKVKKIDLSKNQIKDILNHIVLIKVGSTRRAYEILHDQKNNINNSFQAKKSLKEIVSLVDETSDYLVNCNFRKLGMIINESWKLKKNLSNYISNKEISKLENELSHKIYGGKLLGAGGSGYYLVIASKKTINDLKLKFKDRILNFEIDLYGTKLIS